MLPELEPDMAKLLHCTGSDIQSPSSQSSHADRPMDEDAILQADSMPSKVSNDKRHPEAAGTVAKQAFSGTDEDWFCDFMDPSMFSNECLEDVSQFDILRDISNQGELAAKPQAIEDIVPFTAHEVHDCIDPCLTVKAQLDRVTLISASPNHFHFPVLYTLMNTDTNDDTVKSANLQSFTWSNSAMSTPQLKDLHDSPRRSIELLSPPPSPPTLPPNTDTEPPSISVLGTSSPSENHSICEYCNRLFSRPSDLK
jgi:hypothetical protein